MLVSNYNKKHAEQVITEMNEFTVPALDIAKVKKQEASFAIQWAQLWFRTVVFAQREP